MPATTSTTSNNNNLSPNYIPKTSLDKETRNGSTNTMGTDSRRPSETAEWLLPDYRPTEFRSRSSSVNSRSRSTSGSWDTHQMSAQERQWRKEHEAKSKNSVKKLFSYGFMEGK
ncbi:hypothetical protein M409DRAFT_52261 [Zasmidium cellare ATCC 36951]|uniref:Uncharacterized protein n=1 Tax=Zasmidium cellare ATCC 36951 TaxID=1080233 RepID=A0A6A6CRQ2_ZASCE|nr:uncharacterized protein M409DRAFT_52261 [Zasmidium cellare ATCC 36951]KAF2169755.1 hypothetical protein M409DRAFT_52261 [Zasmidium cellare ATCC 36951]